MLTHQLWLPNMLYVLLSSSEWQQGNYQTQYPSKACSWSKVSKSALKIVYIYSSLGVSLVAQTVKHLSAMQETWVQSLSWEDPLEKEMTAHSSILAWKIPWMAEPSGLPSTGRKESDTDWARPLPVFSGVLIEGSTQLIISLFQETGLIHTRSVIKISFYTPESKFTHCKLKWRPSLSILVWKKAEKTSHRFKEVRW